MPAIVIPSISTKGSPSMIMRSAKVPLSPSGIADNVFLIGRRIRHGLPFDAGRKACAAAPAQARLCHLFDHGGGWHRQRARKPLVTAVRAVVVQRARIDDAASREGQPRLLFEKR